MKIHQNFSLKPYNSFGVDAYADFFVTVRSIRDIHTFLSSLTESPAPILLLGSGSNILFTQDFHGTVIHNNILGINLSKEDSEHVWLEVGAGENWHSFVLYCIDHQYAGAENLSLIPGTVGAAPIQNIGAYGVELESIVDSVTAIHLETCEQRIFSHEECQFGYRDSLFKHTLKNQFMISSVTFRLNKKFKANLEYQVLKQTLLHKKILTPTLKDISDTVIEIRQQKLPDPKKLPNAGSFFKNPFVSIAHFKQLQHNYPAIPFFEGDKTHIKLSAAWLIDTCGLKGITEHGVGISPTHALVLVNYESHSGKDILHLSQKIQQIVYQKYSIHLEAEVNIL